MTSAKGASLTDLRTQNSTTVFHAIRLHAPISRAQLSREVGLTRPTISSALATLRQAGLIRESLPVPDRPHYGATYFEMVPDIAYFVAFEIETTRLRAILGDAAGRRLATRDQLSIPAEPAALVAALLALARAVCDQAGVAFDALVLMVASVPGSVDPGDGRLRSTVLPVFNGFALGPSLSAAAGLPVLVEIDVNLAAIGEREHGAARESDNFVYLSIGNRVAAGIVLGGDVWRGVHGAAGAIRPPGPGPGAADFEHLVLEAVRGRRPSFTALPASVFDAALRGDPLARRIIGEQATRIAATIAVVSQVLDLELAVLGGPIGRRCQPILGSIRERLHDRLPVVPELSISQLASGPARAGACALGAREVMNLVTPDRLARAIRHHARP